MEIELLPTVSLLPETNSLFIAPVELLAGALNSHLELQRYKIHFISGNYSRILNRLNRNITQLDVRRAFTVFQLMTIPTGEPLQLPDRRARPVALRGCREENGGVPGPSALRQDLQGGHHPALRAGARRRFRSLKEISAKSG